MSGADAAPVAPREAYVHLLIGIACLVLVLPHMADQIWFDEALTLTYFSTPHVSHAFTRYDAPNNHVLFSAILSLWQRLPGMVTSFHYRLLPAAGFAAAACLLFSAARRVLALPGALIASALFATSHVTLNFAAQLRGYAPSWVPVAAGTLLLIRHMKTPGRWAAFGYSACAIIAVGIIPTNILAFGILAGWAGLHLIVSGGWRKREGLLRLAWLVTVPFVGLIWYVAILKDLWHHAQTYHTPFTAIGVTGHFLQSTLMDLWWLAPVAAVGMVKLIQEAMRETSWAMTGARMQLLLLPVCIGVTMLFLSVSRSVPFARTLVPILPIWFLALAFPTAKTLAACEKWRPNLGSTLAVLVVGALLLTARVREASGAGYTERVPPTHRAQDLYDLYYHQGFRPAQTVSWLKQNVNPRTSLLLMDGADVGTLRFYHQIYRLDLPYLASGTPGITPEVVRRACSGREIYLLSYCDEEAREVLKRFQELAPRSLSAMTAPAQIQRTGFFRVYRCAARGSLPHE